MYSSAEHIYRKILEHFKPGVIQHGKLGFELLMDQYMPRGKGLKQRHPCLPLRSPLYLYSDTPEQAHSKFRYCLVSHLYALFTLLNAFEHGGDWKEGVLRCQAMCSERLKQPLLPKLDDHGVSLGVPGHKAHLQRLFTVVAEAVGFGDAAAGETYTFHGKCLRCTWCWGLG